VVHGVMHVEIKILALVGIISIVHHMILTIFITGILKGCVHSALLKGKITYKLT